MKDTIIIALACLVAIALGAWLYLSGGTPDGAHDAPAASGLSVLHAGQDSGNLTERKNFRIKSQEEYDSLWRMMYPTDGPTPGNVDFEKQEVLAVFDGSHTSGGYSIEVASVEDSTTERTITIIHKEPGEHCVTTDAITSPFTLVAVARSPLPIHRIDEKEVETCD